MGMVLELVKKLSSFGFLYMPSWMWFLNKKGDFVSAMQEPVILCYKDLVDLYVFFVLAMGWILICIPFLCRKKK